ncbi:hypothetical protein SDC9_131689 [bioreactor metagenome]|uniref:Uncharacterized protein n=1 Tax=bioreactor metagenome TaxID=1076179 RepID=A0A645D5G9_9ZZZZ
MDFVVPFDRRFEIGAEATGQQGDAGDDADKNAQPHQAIRIDRGLGAGSDGSSRRGDRLDVGRHDAREDVGPQQVQHADDTGHDDGVLEGEAEDFRFTTNHAGGSRGDRDGLRRDHLAAHAAAGIGGHGDDRVDAQLFGGDGLQLAEQRVGRGVGTGHEHAQPAEDRGEEREGDAGRGDGVAERDRHAGEVHDVGKAEDGGDGDDRPLQRDQRVAGDAAGGLQ